MPLHIILPIVIFGIAGIVLLVHLTGGTVTRRIADLADAQKLWAGDFPDEVLSDLRIDDPGRVALVQLQDGRQGILWAFGGDAVVRHLIAPPEVAETDTGLTLRLRDYTAPAIRVTLADKNDRAAWRAALNKPKETHAWTTSHIPT